jgi:hypothetical protein
MSWIETAKEMPDDESTVLIYVEQHTEPVWMGYKDGDDWRTVDAELIQFPVTHWMPLPEPPTIDPKA